MQISPETRRQSSLDSPFDVELEIRTGRFVLHALAIVLALALVCGLLAALGAVARLLS